jgi:hypothetical protein
MESALQNLKDFIIDLEGKGDLSKQNLEPFEIGLIFGHYDEGLLVLNREETNEYRECLDELYYSRETYQHHSKRAVELLMQKAILYALDIKHELTDMPFEDRLANAIKEIREKLMDHPKPWVVHMRIEGLAPEGLPYKFGKVNFWVADENNLDELKKPYNAIIDGRTDPPETKLSLKTEFENSIKKYFLGFPIASVEVSACDGEAACSVARRELRLTMDVINFYSDILISTPGLGAQLRFVGELQPTSELLLAFGINPSFFYLSHKFVGPLTPVSFKKVKLVEEAESVGFYRINEILAKDNRSPLEEKILASIQWAGKAAVERQQRPEEAFLHYAIALETIMLGRQQDIELSYRLSMRTALLTGDTPENREKVKKEVRDLYNIRSKIVHSGHYEVANADVERIRVLAFICIMRILNEKPFISMNEEQEIDNWFDKAMLSGRLLIR